MSMIVLPYLGAAAAERELARPAPTAVAARAARDARGPAARVSTCASPTAPCASCSRSPREPGASNRHVGDTAGIADQGQTSKLLRRLQHLGLIENATPRRRPRAASPTPGGSRPAASDCGAPIDPRSLPRD